MESDQSQPQTQYSRCQIPSNHSHRLNTTDASFPTNHRNSLKQFFSELISKSHKPVLLRAISESLLRISSDIFPIPLCRYHETTTQQLATLANQQHQLRYHQAADTCITKQQAPAPTSTCIFHYNRPDHTTALESMSINLLGLSSAL